jgi:hypothetical protein
MRKLERRRKRSEAGGEGVRKTAEARRQKAGGKQKGK